MRRHNYVTRCECFDSSNEKGKRKGGKEHDVQKCDSLHKKERKIKKQKQCKDKESLFLDLTVYMNNSTGVL